MTARKTFGSEFHTDGPAYVKARSPNLVRNRGRKKSDEDRRSKTATWATAVDGTRDHGEIVRALPVEYWVHETAVTARHSGGPPFRGSWG